MRLRELKEGFNCKYCSNPATQEVVWANGRGVIRTCNDHVTNAKQEIKRRNDEVVQVNAL